MVDLLVMNSLDFFFVWKSLYFSFTFDGENFVFGILHWPLFAFCKKKIYIFYTFVDILIYSYIIFRILFSILRQISCILPFP